MTKPTAIPPDVVTSILAELAGGKTLKSICKILGFDDRKIRHMIAADPEFAAKVHAARVSGTDYVMDEIREFGERELEPGKVYDAARDRVALDALKFYVARMNPERYGDRIDMNVRGKLDMGAILIAADQRLAALPRPGMTRLPDITTEEDE